ncbi:uncharacterized protein FFB20_07938 [Fusarium fujikuroi]|nr:uncharacterized protein FFB20_07938 [Fusarium fujikuroi]SCN92586.1 uncharacterized protein FFE2_07410 [Fusarium fujikuroi]
MASNSSSPLLFVPLHVVGYILEHAGSIQQLGRAISSHRIFYNAFKEYPRCIAQGIITKQIPQNILPYALLLLECNRIAPGDFQTLKEIIARFCPKDRRPGDLPYDTRWFHLVPEAPASPPLLLNTLSWSDYACLSQDYEAVLLLRQAMAEESIAMLRTFGIKHTTSLTAAEKFRLDRSFYLFQTICNTFCTEVWPNGGSIFSSHESLDPHENWRDEYAAELLSYCFSPWVNHQLQSVYRFLERNIVRSFRYIADNDVGYAGWELRHSSVFQDCLRHDELLTRGLSFHSEVYQAKAFEDISKLLKPPSATHSRWDSDRLSEVFRSLTDPLEEFAQQQYGDLTIGYLSNGVLEFMQGPQDGGLDGMESSSIRSWKCAFRHHHIGDYGLTTHQSWLLECAYVMWDYSDISDRLLSERLSVMMSTQSPPEADMCSEEYAEFIRSRTQREQIYALGGEGWWPTTGVDFSRVTGLTDEDKEELISVWRANGWVKPLKRKRSDSSSSSSSAMSTITVRRRYA